MSAEEFLVEFDILFNSISSNMAPSYNELEKSILATQAKELVVKDLYSGKSGPYEANEEVTEYLSRLTKQVNYSISSDYVNGEQYNFELQDDCWNIIYEQAKLKKDGCEYYVQVTPVSHNEFAKAVDNPFRGPDRRTVLRVNIGNAVQLYCDKNVELLGYTMRYLSQPEKIYLDVFSDNEAPAEWLWNNSSFYDSSKQNNGWDEYSKNVCPDLPESLHRLILIKAVQLAKAAWQ